MNGALLDTGVTLRLPPLEAARWANLLQSGQTVSVRGTSLATSLHLVIIAEATSGSSSRRCIALDGSTEVNILVQ